MIDPFSISFYFDDRRSPTTSAKLFANEEWNNLGLFKRIGLNKEEFIKTESEEYFQNHLEELENENEREDGDEKEEEERKIREEEEKKIREEEERKIREEEERKMRPGFISSSNQLQV